LDNKAIARGNALDLWLSVPRVFESKAGSFEFLMITHDFLKLDQWVIKLGWMIVVIGNTVRSRRHMSASHGT
jgi:hypothetical protein